MMGHKEKLKCGDEYDAVTGWRKVTFWQKHELKKIKRRLHKRMRQKIKRQLNAEMTPPRYDEVYFQGLEELDKL